MTSAPMPEDTDALRVAVQALDMALARHREAFMARDTLRTHASGVESVWWICAIDEQLGRPSADAPVWEDPTQEAPFKMDADWFGARSARGLRWVRDCHSHQLPLTTRIHVRSYIDPRPPGPFLSVSTWVVWKATDEIRSDAARESKAGRRAYEERVAGHNSVDPLSEAAGFLRRKVEALDTT